MRATPLAIVLVLLPAIAFAQEPPGPDFEPEPEPAACVPECRAGFVCHQGQCISACNPGCKDNEVCTAAAECASACNPACAGNEICNAGGQCISRCNQACPAGQTCGANGECGGVAGGFVAPTGPTDPGWARGAYIYGLVATIVGAALGIAIVIADDSDVGLALGIPATLLVGVSIPVTAAGGRSARKKGFVIGNPGLRLYSWITYGLVLLGATVSIGLNIADVETPDTAGPLTLVGVSSALAMAIDARSSAAQAERGGIIPSIGAVRDAGDKVTPTVGIGVSW